MEMGSAIPPVLGFGPDSATPEWNATSISVGDSAHMRHNNDTTNDELRCWGDGSDQGLAWGDTIQSETLDGIHGGRPPGQGGRGSPKYPRVTATPVCYGTTARWPAGARTPTASWASAAPILSATTRDGGQLRISSTCPRDEPPLQHRSGGGHDLRRPR